MKKIILCFCILQCIFSTIAAQTFIEERRFGGFGTKPGKLNQPQALSISQNKIIYLVDTGNNRIQLFDLNGKFIKTVGGFGFGNDQFDHPVDIWVKSIINIYVCDYNNQRLLRYDMNMNFISSLVSNDGDSPEFQFYEVASCAVSSQKDLFFLDHGDNKIIKINRNGQKERSFGAYEAGDGELNQPVQLDIINQQFLIVSDISRTAILKFDFFGNFAGKMTGKEDITPTGISVSNNGIVFACDPANKKIYRSNPGTDELIPIMTTLQKPFTKPQDCALFEENINNILTQKLYIIDDNEIIIGKLVIQ
jgi:tripartite motif-containing protein 71